ncbi:hypothetical protein KCM76_04875 [Zooshikella marina]|uniref:hypothetical protein n=1 Tax=Zooshikella ganghwensis TaxID=202772 RepID=UPI001BAE777B|nr:hypothetical protein [Zooshikella ganghwensis]MBU2705301.1 hypothetical protein [Zooshikella ganghwensis]
MDKQEILKILGKPESFKENAEGSALTILIQSEALNVVITVPYQVTELIFEVQSKEGKTLLSDKHDFYGASEYEDFKESLLEITDIIKSPELRLTNNGKTVEAKGYKWYYWFGEFCN